MNTDQDTKKQPEPELNTANTQPTTSSDADNVTSKHKNTSKRFHNNFAFIALSIFVLIIGLYSATGLVVGITQSYNPFLKQSNTNASSPTEESYIRDKVKKYYHHFKVTKITYEDTTYSSFGIEYHQHEYRVSLTNDMNYCGLDGLIFEYGNNGQPDEISKTPTVDGVNGGIDQYDSNTSYGDMDFIYSYEYSNYSVTARDNLIRLVNTSGEYCNDTKLSDAKVVMDFDWGKPVKDTVNKDMAINTSRKLKNYYLIQVRNKTTNDGGYRIYYLENDSWILVP